MAALDLYDDWQVNGAPRAVTELEHALAGDLRACIDALDRVRALAQRWKASKELGAASIMVRAAIDGTEPS